MTSVTSHTQTTLIDSNDLHLTKDPTLNVFIPKNRTYTPVSQDYVFHRPVTQISGLPGEQVKFSLRRKGDLLTNMYLRMRGLPPLIDIYPDINRGTFLGNQETTEDLRERFKWGPLQYYAFDSVSLRLNSTVIDTLYGDWMYVWSECLQPTPNRGEGKTLTTKMMTPDRSVDLCVFDKEYFYLPIPFWFTKHPSLALPLIALANTEIEIIITFAKTINGIPLLNTTVTSSGQQIKTNNALSPISLRSLELVTLEATLCESERQWFATNPTSYLITQHNQRMEEPFTLSQTPINIASDYTPVYNATNQDINILEPDKQAINDVTIDLDAFRLPIKQLWVGQGGLMCKSRSETAVNAATFFTDNRLITGCFFKESYILNDSRDITERSPLPHRSNFPFYQDGKHIGISSSIKKQFLRVAGETIDSNGENTLSLQPSVFSFNMELDDIHPHGAINFSRLKSGRLVLRGAKTAAFPNYLQPAFRVIEGNYVILSENYNVLDIRNGSAYLRFTD